MKPTYDVIVIGAGNGGLAAGALTAQAGYKTLVLEKHNLPGGCATSFVRGRFEFEPSLHELCHESTSPKTDSAKKIFDRLGADLDLAFEDKLFRVINLGRDPYDVRVSAGYEAFLDSMEAAVPGCRAGVKELIDLIGVIDEAQAYMAEGPMNPAVLLTKYGDFIRVASHSINEVMDALGIPRRAQEILNTYWGYLGVPSDDLNALHYISLLTAYLKNTPSMPYLRSHELSLSLVKALQGYGGEIRYNSEVTRVLFDGARAVGVEVNGERLFAKKIISNVIPNNIFNMSDPEAIPARAKKLANARRLGMTFITVYLGLDATMEELGIEDYSTFILRDPDPRVQYEQRKGVSTYVVNCLNKVLPDSSPAGTCTLFFTIMIMPNDLPDDLTPQTYKAYKEAFAEKYIRDYEKTLGISVMDRIEEIEIATPVTFARYLGTPGGAIYGYASQEWDNVVGRTVTKDLDYAIPNLHFCGGHYLQGDGYPSGYITGAMTAQDVIAELKEGK